MRLSPRRAARAFTLTEVTLSLGVAGFCLVTIFGLLPVGLASNQTAIQQTTAANISSAIISDLHTTQPLGLNQSPRYGLSIPGDNGTSSSVNPALSGTMQTLFLAANGTAEANPGGMGANAAIYRATVFFTPPAAPASAPTTGQRNATQVRVLVTWPAMADTSISSAPKNYSGSYDSETALDCN
jgi:hypothetical protein